MFNWFFILFSLYCLGLLQTREEKSKMKLNIEMNKKEAKDYFNKKGKPLFDLRNKRTQGYLIIGVSLIGGIALMVLIAEGFTPPPIPKDYSSLLNMGWNQLLKLGLIIAFPFIIISWIIHGIQVRLLA